MPQDDTRTAQQDRARHRRGDCWRLAWRPDGPWYAWRWDGARGQWMRRSTGCTLRRAAAEVAARWLQEGERQAAGLRTGTDAAAATPLAAHVRAFVAARRNAPEGLTGNHVRQLARSLERVMERAGWRWLADVSEDGLHAAMAGLSAASRRRGGWSAASRNHCLVAWGAFCRWAVRDGRLAANPLANVRAVRVEGFRTFHRRALTRTEAERLLVATAAGPEAAGMAGPERAMLYRLALVTGFRRGELASLTPGSFRLDMSTPAVELQAKAAKSRTRAQQPLPPWIVPELRRWLAGRPRGGLLWPGLPACLSDVVRADADAAGIPLVDQDGARLDFHALRHTFGTWLALAGVTPQAAQRLMRHQSIHLTMRVYTHLGLDELGRSVAGITLDRCGPVAEPETHREAQMMAHTSDTRTGTAETATQDRRTAAEPQGATDTQVGADGARGTEMAWPGFEPGSRQLANECQSIAAPSVAVAGHAPDAPALHRRHARERAEAGERPDLGLAVARIAALGSIECGKGVPA